MLCEPLTRRTGVSCRAEDIAYASLRQGEDGSKSIFVRYEEVSCCLRQPPTGGGWIQVYICQVRRGLLLLMPASDRGRTDPSLYLSGMKRSPAAYANLRQGKDGSKSIFVRYEEVSCYLRQPPTGGGRSQVYIYQV
jgi:hypothetical protein